MSEVLSWVEACLWKIDPGVEVLSSPLRWTTYSPDGTSANVPRKTPLPTDWREQPESDVSDGMPASEPSLVSSEALPSSGNQQRNMPAVSH